MPEPSNTEAGYSLESWSVDELITEVVRRGVSLAGIEAGSCRAALQASGTIVGAAAKLEITRHALKRRIQKHGLRKDWKA